LWKIIILKLKKQTRSDIIRTNQIVNRIFTSQGLKQENNETLNFLILGEKKFHMISKYLNKQNKLDEASRGPLYFELQAFNLSWSKYEIFKHFTDFDFNQVTIDQKNKIIKQLSSKIELINEYPGLGSIQQIDNTVILVLDKKLLKK